MSVAGRRAGLSGEHSGLWWEFHRIIDEVRPEWVVIENVPGLLSSNDGKDIAVIMDAIDDLRYVVDVDMLDAQYFGLAQRRKRVFIICQSVDAILKKKTPSSAQTIAQCFIEILGSILVEARSQSNIEFKSSLSRRSFSLDGLQKRMKLFGLQQEGTFPKLRVSLDAERARFPKEHEYLVFLPGGVEEKDTDLTIMDGQYVTMTEGTGNVSASWDTVPSWKSILDEICEVAKSFTTSTELRQIAESRIYTCAMAALSISTFIGLSDSSCPTYWNAASSALTVLQEYMSYAKQASESLFTDAEWIHPWSDFLRRSRGMCQSVFGLGDGTGSFKILPLPESLCGDSAPSRETGARVAASLTRGAESSGRGGYAGRRREDDVNLVARALTACKTATGRLDPSEQTLIPSSTPWDSQRMRVHDESGVCPTLSQSDSKGGQRTPIVSVAENQRGEVRTSDIHPQLTCGGGKPGEGYPCVAFHENKSGQLSPDKIAKALRSGASHTYQGVSQGMSIRRLTPIECCRLQGFPDDWLDVQYKGKPLSDSARYRMLGNAVAVPVAEWIGRKIAT